MKEPAFHQPTKQVKPKFTQSKKTKAAARVVRKNRPSRRRIIGGKAIARLLNFTQQREVEKVADKRKQPTVVPTRKLVCSKHPKANGSARTERKENAKAATPSRTAAFNHAATLLTAPVETVRQVWRPLGPFCIPHGQTYGAGPGCRPSISGRISALAIDPNDANHILIGSGGGGGVWETKSGGNVWAPRTDDQPSLSIGAIAFSPSNPLFVYAGTGEGDSTFVDDPNLLGVGLLRSTDGGTTWNLITRQPFEKVGFYELAVDPLDANHILAATTEGLFESDDGGLSWKQRRKLRAWDLSVRPLIATDSNSTKEVFAGCSDGVFRSTNGGTSWSAVSLPGAPSSYERVEVCHAPSDGNVVYVFAASPDPTDPDNNPIPHLWRRTVFGGAFERIRSLPEDLVTEQSWYDWFARVAPNNPDVLYLGAINAHKGIRLASGAWQWENISAKEFGNSIHPDMHVIAFSPTDPNEVYIGCDGGIFRSPNGGKDWASLNKGLCLTEVEFLAQHPQFEAWLIAGTQDNGTLQYKGNEVWYHVSDGDGGDCGVSSSSPYICYHTFYGMGLARSTRGGGWDTWPQPPNETIGPPVTASEDYPSGAIFYPPVEVNGRTVVQAGKKVFISTDNADSWTKVALHLGSEELSSALAVPSTTRILVGTTKGRLYRLNLVGGNWNYTKLAKPVTGYISDIIVDPTNPNRIFVTYQSSDTGSHVFRSDNAGESWNDVSEGLPNIAANAIELDPMNPNTIFVAADVGVYRSDNAGAQWALFNIGLPNALVKDLAFHAPSRLLRAGTQARGVWEIAVDEATLPGVEIYLRDNPVDTGRVSPSPIGINDPFNFGAQAFWWQSVDIKVDAASFHTAALDDVDFEIFGDDQSMVGTSEEDLGIQFANGLLPENPQRGQVVRVYARVNNRGVNPALNVVVKVFFAPSTSTIFPDLPANFWANFPNNVLPSTSGWQPIASHKVIPSVAAGSSQIVGFEWPVPSTSVNTIALLAITSSDNDPLVTSELNITSLVTGNKKCGLRNVTVVNPSPGSAPLVKALNLNVTGAGEPSTFSLLSTQTTPSLLRAVVLSKRLSKLAKKAKFKKVKLSFDDKQELARLIESSLGLKDQLDMKSAFVAPKGAWFERLELTGDQSEPMVIFINRKAQAGVASVMQVSEDGTIVGGHTFQAVASGLLE